jgi:hypothetical protein
VWGIFAIAAIITFVTAIREARRNNLSNSSAKQKRNVAIGGGVTNSTIVTGDKNIVANSQAKVAGKHGVAA